MVDDAVAANQSPRPKLPANREKYREIYDTGPLRQFVFAAMDLILGTLLLNCRESLNSEFGCAEQGKSIKDQGILQYPPTFRVVFSE